MSEPYYADDSAIVYLGDSVELMDELPDGSVELVLTDPPYSSGARRDAEKSVRGAMLRSFKDEDWFSHDAMTGWGFQWFVRQLFGRMAPKLVKGAHVYCFIDWRQTPNVYAILESAGYRVNHCLVWQKTAFGMGSYWRNQHENIVFASAGQPKAMLDRGMGSVLTCATVSSAKRVHPTEKPLALLDKIIKAVPGGVLLDPFAGSGTSLVAAVQNGRQAIGFEIDERYAEIAAKRLRALADARAKGAP